VLEIALGVLGAAAVYRAGLHALYAEAGPQRQRFTAQTRDGAIIALYRIPPAARRYAEPVLLCHGLGANRFNLDFCLQPQYSVAEAFAREGFDSWVVELRGVGASRLPPGHKDWTFDDYLAQDLPAAIDQIREMSGAEQIHWVGHSMGGMLLYAYLLGPRGAEVRSGVTLGSPARFSGGAERFWLEIRLAFLLRVLRRVHVRALTRWTVPIAGRVPNRFVRAMVNLDNVDPALLRRAQYVAPDDFSAGLARQFLGWVLEGSIRSGDGKICWTEALPKIQQPLLVVAGGGDRLVPVEDVRFVHEAIGSSKAEYLELSRRAGFDQDYGHIDLVFGRQAPRLVFPRLVDFVRRHARELRS
jgi:pimeloyl-ACP methyl ester carboxylesterase